MGIKDLRYRRTESLLYQSLFFLLKEKEFHAVKVSELTNQAGVSRQAFYSHYEDKYDFLDQLNSLLITRIQNQLQLKKTSQKVTILVLVLEELLADHDFCLDLNRLSAINKTICEPNFDSLKSRLEQLFSTYFSGYSWKTDCYNQTEYFQHFLGGMITNALFSAIDNQSDIPLKILHTHLSLFDS
ncbi:TetR/AcrR family transcriptional regulator [Enterococcus sp. BWM-S5]|uniref:TetR/AcrR family transcriptional regulator n=1 Tax=Enterococcus larvae TaxID=2794352 RepID=A0ABS4CM15_9ENTE|nr:TetR/AcrR family transcriptional regulator [Enterococcus larvae]MBP1047156.1 TetR/AcrR family transcriptional regulator [Enterococcus larvae]